MQQFAAGPVRVGADPSSKVDKAKKAGVATLDEAAFLAMLEG